MNWGDIQFVEGREIDEEIGPLSIFLEEVSDDRPEYLADTSIELNDALFDFLRRTKEGDPFSGWKTGDLDSFQWRDNWYGCGGRRVTRTQKMIFSKFDVLGFLVCFFSLFS